MKEYQRLRQTLSDAAASVMIKILVKASPLNSLSELILGQSLYSQSFFEQS